MEISKEVVEAQAVLYQDASVYLTSIALRCAIQLGISDAISSQESPVTLEELVAKLSVPAAKTAHLNRLMRLLVHRGYFAIQKDQDGRQGYVLTTLSKLLSSNNQFNLSPMVLFVTDPILVTPCLYTADWFRGPCSTPFDAVHGMSVYEYVGKHPAANSMFNAAMGCDSELVMKALIKDLKPKLEGYESLVDVGGGNGTAVKAIAEAAPHLKLSVYDRPHVISDIKDMGDITLIPGDMFEFIPSADIIQFKNILIDWSDEDCLKILKQCKKAISREDGGKKVIIVDPVTDAQVDPEAITSQLHNDLFLMTFLTGKGRTEAEWKKIFLEAGFTNYTMTPSLRWNTIIEVFP